jgi:hypothetical protein
MIGSKNERHKESELNLADSKKSKNLKKDLARKKKPKEKTDKILD